MLFEKLKSTVTAKNVSGILLDLKVHDIYNDFYSFIM